MAKPVLTQAYVRNLFDYHSDGYLVWKSCADKSPQWNGRCAGRRAGSLVKGTRGEWVVGIDTINYGLHRVIFLYHHGFMPDEIDHIDLNPSNNRIENLRKATHSQNNTNKRRQINNTSGHKGVRYRKDRSHWVAGITFNKVGHYLGSYATREEAVKAYEDAASKIHGEFARLE